MNKIILLFGAVISISYSFAQNDARIHLNKGQKYFVENKITANTTQSLMGQAMESNASISSNYTIEVKDKKDNNYNLSNTYSNMKFKLSAMGSDMNFDSDKKEDMEGENGAYFKNFINKPKEVNIENSGKIISAKNDVSKAGSPQSDIMKMMISQLLGDPEETGYGVNVAFAPVSAKYVVGYSWTDSIKGEGMQRSTTYTIKEVNGNDALVLISGTLITDTKAQMQGMEIVNKSNGKISGEEILDVTTGVIKNRATTLETSGSMSAQGLEIPITSTINFVSSVKPS